MRRVVRHLSTRLQRRTKGGQKSRTTASGLTIPTKWWRRWLWYVNPKRFRDFWFTKDGAKTAAKIAGIWAGIGFAMLLALFLYFAKDLPTPGQINSRLLAQTTRFYDRSGQTLLYEVHGDQNRTVVKLEDISPNMRNAAIAIEDKNFYRHGAFSSLSIIRAAVNNVLNRNQGVQGGSTITQQYVKNALLSPERTFTRKVKELILSIQIEQLYNKDDILELYLNEIPYGAQAYGAQAAAKTYFNKDAKDLTADEAALLAALPRAPTYYSPYGQHLDELFTRQDLILDLMHDQGYLNDQDWQAAKDTDTYAKVSEVPNLYANIKAPHFVLYAEEFLKEKLGERQVSEG
ncbi:penicillin-binding protein, partial [Candidatus Microgenomates bacterium]|nr:penicillin-binding protein [Candidatus Microgenomates bacterium]